MLYSEKKPIWEPWGKEDREDFSKDGMPELHLRMSKIMQKVNIGRKEARCPMKEKNEQREKLMI